MTAADSITASTNRKDDAYGVLHSLGYHLCNIPVAADVEPISAPLEALAVSNALNNLFMLFDENASGLLRAALDSSQPAHDPIGIHVEVHLADDRMGIHAELTDTTQSASANLEYTAPETISGVAATAVGEFQQTLLDVRNDECTIKMYFQQTGDGLRFDYDITPDVDSRIINAGHSLNDRIRDTF